MRVPVTVLIALPFLALPARMVRGAEEGCGVCHGKERVQYATSIHRAGDLGCVSCHGGDPAPAESKEAAHSKEKGFLGRVSRADAAMACGRCHADVARMRPYGLRADVLDAWASSHHGKAVLGKGDADAATCLDCHGSHDVRRVSDPASPASRSRVPATCGTCHGNAEVMKRHGLPAEAPRDYAASVHGRRLAEGEPGVPTCADCHDAHAASPPGADEVAATCGNCHRDVLETFREGPHFSASKRGEMKQCVSCHGNHAVTAPDFDLFDRPAPADAPPHSGQRCVACHDASDPKDRGAATALAFGRGLRETTAAIRDAAVRVDGVAAGGHFVDDEREALEQARREVVHAVPLTHSGDAARVEASLRRARSFVAEALEGADGKAREERDRRILGTFAAVVLFGIAGFLALRRRGASGGA